MPRKKSPVENPAPENSGFDVPALTPDPEPSLEQPQAEPNAVESEEHVAVPEASPTEPESERSPVNATSVVTVPKAAFLRLQKMQTLKAREEQLRQLAQRHPVVRDLLNELQRMRRSSAK